MALASIVSGYFHGSTSVTVALDSAAPAGATLLIYRGDFLLGSLTAPTAAPFTASIPVTALATGDLIQASINTRGNGCGFPRLVTTSPTQPTGWLSPTTLSAVDAAGNAQTYTVEQYIAAFGSLPAAVYDPLLAGVTRLPPNYETPSPVELGFDVLVTTAPGTASLSVVARGTEALLVGYNDATPGQNVPITLTASGTTKITVQRDDSTASLTRFVAVTVPPANTSPGTPAAGDVWGLAYKLGNGGYVNFYANANKACEVRIVGVNGSAWSAATQRNRDNWEVAFSPVPVGNYTVELRAIGETATANYIREKLFIVSWENN